MSGTQRRVVLICGPPGAGKTTHAHTLGLEVYDLDDPQWANDERRFNAALHTLRTDRTAQAAVIRAGATRRARAIATHTVAATEVTIITTDLAECMRRVKSRNRPRPSLDRQLAAVRKWWDTFEPDPLRTTREW